MQNADAFPASPSPFTAYRQQNVKTRTSSLNLQNKIPLFKNSAAFKGASNIRLVKLKKKKGSGYSQKHKETKTL